LSDRTGPPVAGAGGGAGGPARCSTPSGECRFRGELAGIEHLEEARAAAWPRCRGRLAPPAKGADPSSEAGSPRAARRWGMAHRETLVGFSAREGARARRRVAGRQLPLFD